MQNQKGNLYIVATPIGNLQDITLRAIEALKNVDFIVCEDTRVTLRLLNHYKIKKPLIALNEFNEEQILYEILKKLETKACALVSDAGTPLISDPGYRLVKEAKRKKFQVIPVPGASALIAALSVSGLPTDKFIYLGFLPKSEARAGKLLNKTKLLEQTVILYESPHRIVKTLELIANIFGDIEITIARELTKIYEETRSEKVSTHIEHYKKILPKGEFVVLFSLKR